MKNACGNQMCKHAIKKEHIKSDFKKHKMLMWHFVWHFDEAPIHLSVTFYLNGPYFLSATLFSTNLTDSLFRPSWSCSIAKIQNTYRGINVNGSKNVISN